MQKAGRFAPGLVWKNRRRPTLPGPFKPSTIGAEGLNCSVRNGKRCFPLAIATGNQARPVATLTPRLYSAGRTHAVAPTGLENRTCQRTKGIKNIRQALDPLVPVSYACHHA